MRQVTRVTLVTGTDTATDMGRHTSTHAHTQKTRQDRPSLAVGTDMGRHTSTHAHTLTHKTRQTVSCCRDVTLVTRSHLLHQHLAVRQLTSAYVSIREDVSRIGGCECAVQTAVSAVEALDSRSQVLLIISGTCVGTFLSLIRQCLSHA